FSWKSIVSIRWPSRRCSRASGGSRAGASSRTEQGSPMVMLRPVLVLAAPLLLAAGVSAQMPPRALVDALGAIYRLRDYTAFDWISGAYDRGTLTLAGLVQTPELKTQAEETARGVRGV